MLFKDFSQSRANTILYKCRNGKLSFLLPVLNSEWFSFICVWLSLRWLLFLPIKFWFLKCLYIIIFYKQRYCWSALKVETPVSCGFCFHFWRNMWDLERDEGVNFVLIRTLFCEWWMRFTCMSLALAGLCVRLWPITGVRRMEYIYWLNWLWLS